MPADGDDDENRVERWVHRCEQAEDVAKLAEIRARHWQEEDGTQWYERG